MWWLVAVDRCSTGRGGDGEGCRQLDRLAFHRFQNFRPAVLVKFFERRPVDHPLRGVLSGGERRRLEITRALATTPSFMLLDEPFAGIDPLAVIDIKNIIRHLKRRNIGIIISDHNVRETLEVCDQAYILNNGQIIESGPPEKIASSEIARRIYLGDEFRL